VFLRCISLREEMIQESLAKMTGILRANISAMEHVKPPIGKERQRSWQLCCTATIASFFKCRGF
jgi:transcriptional regulator